MEYMESIKELEEKMVSNQRRHNRDGFFDDKHIEEVLLLPHILALWIVSSGNPCLGI